MMTQNTHSKMAEACCRAKLSWQKNTPPENTAKESSLKSLWKQNKTKPPDVKVSVWISQRKVYLHNNVWCSCTQKFTNIIVGRNVILILTSFSLTRVEWLDNIPVKWFVKYPEQTRIKQSLRARKLILSNKKRCQKLCQNDANSLLVAAKSVWSRCN